ncbi:DUF6527 family protein [Flagellimonas amoyensis]|uniref:DUF6527 family protein n=1 Tax=Flagellimonas amoyensis TaxID=2169401 RepID=UPI000D3A67E3|nr:DUF6527 family protein [Allomuricauda amoyensis]
MKTVRLKFLEQIPEKLEDGVLYISMEYGTVLHNCCCGCGSEVNTPLSPASWKMEYNGETVTLDPSIGNWSFPCKSHYWIKNNKVIWCKKWSQSEVNIHRKEEAQDMQIHYSEKKKKGMFARLWNWVR